MLFFFRNYSPLLFYTDILFEKHSITVYAKIHPPLSTTLDNGGCAVIKQKNIKQFTTDWDKY